jgi:hypothetical protein
MWHPLERAAWNEARKKQATSFIHIVQRTPPLAWQSNIAPGPGLPGYLGMTKHASFYCNRGTIKVVRPCHMISSDVHHTCTETYAYVLGKQGNSI